MWVLEKCTCGAENTLSPALVAEPFKLPYNILYHWHGTNLAIQKAFHLQALPDSTRRAASFQLTYAELRCNVYTTMGRRLMAHILKQYPRNSPVVFEGLLEQAEDMSDQAGGLAAHPPPQASTAHIYAGEARCHKLSLLRRQ